jgi:flagellar FliJ protein
MKRSERLSVVIELAAKATEEALLKVSQANAVWVQDKQQLADLNQYKGEYLAKLRDGNQAIMSGQKVMEFRAFLGQLDQAIIAQEHQIARSLGYLQQRQQTWRQVRIKEQAMQSLIERYQQEENQQLFRQEQNESDEHNTAQWLRKQK